MKRFLLIAVVFGLTAFLFAMTTSQQGLTGKYKSQTKMDVVYLTLKQDSTYNQNWSSCTFEFNATGKWAIAADTLVLNPTKIKAKRSKYESELVATKQINKYLIKQDTLISLLNTNGGYKRYFALIRK